MSTNHGLSTRPLEQDNDPVLKKVDDVVGGWDIECRSSVKLWGKWPPNSPGLSHNVNLWVVFRRVIQACECHNVVEFQDTVKRKVRSHGTKMVGTLMHNIAKRVKIPLEGKG